MSEVFDTNIVHFDSSGAFLNGGRKFFGKPNADPTVKANKITIFNDRGLTVVLPNPIGIGPDGKTINKVWVGERYSYEVQDKNNVKTENQPDQGETSGAGEPIVLSNVQGTNAITAEASPPFSEFIDGQIYILKQAEGDNTGNMTLTVTGSTPTLVPIKKNHDEEIQAGGVKDNQQIELIFNPTGPVLEIQSNVQFASGPSSSVAGNIPAFADLLGKNLLDSGVSSLGPLAFTVFTTGGTWTRNAKTKSAWIFCIGAGGGGAGTSTTGIAGGGGGGGGLSIAFITSFTSGTDTVAIGAGGNGGAVNGGGGNGGDVSVGTLCVAEGGSGAASGGGAGAGAVLTDAVGDLKLRGANGSTSTSQATTSNHAGGTGGGSFLGSGGEGGLGGGGVGGTAVVEGSGGGGAGGTSTNSGGAGKSGLVFILEFA